jgi:hypothetical protein
MIKIRPIERFVLIAWVIAVLYVFAFFRGQIHPEGHHGELIKAFLAYLSAGYLQ